MLSDLLRVIIRDIRFWLLVYFLCLLPTITQAPLEPSHAWRQSLTNMVARNFYQEPTPIQYPRIDLAGELEGFIGSELPLLPYLTAMTYKLFGFAHWHGRLINLIVSFLGIWFFYRAIKIATNKERMAFWAAFFLLNSIWLSFSRKIMPDTFSVALCLMAGYFALRFLRSNKLLQLSAFVIFAMVGIMCKIPAALVLVPIGLLVFDSGFQLRARLTLMVAGIIALTGPGIWYGYWVPHLVNTYHFQLFFPKSLAEGFLEVAANWQGLIDKLVYKSFFSFTTFLLAIFGVYLIVKNKNRKGLWMMGLVGLIFTYYIVKTGSVFPTHSYYIVPFVPFMALAAGYGFSKLRFQPRYLYFIALLAVSESVLTQMNDFFIRPNKQYLLTLEDQCDKFSDRRNKIVCNGTPNPQLIYFLNRRGWSVTNEQLSDAAFLNALIEMNARWLILDRHANGTDALFDAVKTRYPVIYTSNDLVAFELASE